MSDTMLLAAGLSARCGHLAPFGRCPTIRRHGRQLDQMIASAKRLQIMRRIVPTMIKSSGREEKS